MDNTERRSRTRRQCELNMSKQKKRKRRKLPRSAKKEAILDYCCINGTKNCDGEKKVPMAAMNSCTCSLMCIPCAKKWFKTSSNCPFCRKEVSMLNGNVDIAHQRQREDHDLEVASFQFPYRNWLGELDVFYAHLNQSQIFANKRGKLKLPKEVLFMIKCIDSLNQDILNQNAYYHLITRKIYSFRGKRRQAIYRILFYYSMVNRNPIALFFLCTLLRRGINDRDRNKKKKLFDLRDNSPLECNKAIFHDLPDKCLFEKSCFEVLQENSNTRHWYILRNILCFVFPNEEKNLRINLTEVNSEEEEEIEFLDVLVHV